MIYVISSGDAIKVGYSETPEKRLKQLQTGSSKPLFLLNTFWGDKQIEQKLHQALRDYSLQGEWFVSCKQVFDVIDGFRDNLTRFNDEETYIVMRLLAMMDTGHGAWGDLLATSATSIYIGDRCLYCVNRRIKGLFPVFIITTKIQSTKTECVEAFIPYCSHCRKKLDANMQDELALRFDDKFPSPYAWMTLGDLYNEQTPNMKNSLKALQHEIREVIVRSGVLRSERK